MTKQRLAIIGATGSGLKRTIPALANSVTVEIVAIQGRNSEKIQTIREQHGIDRSYTKVQDLLADGGFDFVYVATPPFLHFENLQAIAPLKTPIICEKPLAQNLAEAQRIYAMLKDYEAPFMLAHHLRHQPAMEDVKNAIKTGSLGEVTSMWCQWGFQLNQSAPNASWKLRPDLGGYGPFSDAGVHMVDLALHFLGNPSTVTSHEFRLAFPSTNDNATALLCYKNCTAALNAAQNMAVPGNHLLIYGTKGKIEAFAAFGEKSTKEVHFHTGINLESRQYPVINLYGAEVENFAAVLTGSATDHPGTTLLEALTAAKVLDAIQTSAETGAHVLL